MSSEQRSAPAPAHNLGSPRQRLLALLRSTDGRLGLICYVAFAATTVLSSTITFFGGWRHPNLVVLDLYKLFSVVMYLSLLLLCLRFLWRFPLWAHCLVTLGILGFFIEACFSPLFTGVEGPLADAVFHLGTVLSTIGLVSILLGGFPLMVAAALNKFRLPPPEEHHWFMSPRRVDTISDGESRLHGPH